MTACLRLERPLRRLASTAEPCGDWVGERDCRVELRRAPCDGSASVTVHGSNFDVLRVMDTAWCGERLGEDGGCQMSRRKETGVRRCAGDESGLDDAPPTP